MNEEIRKLEKRFISLEKMVNNHYEVLNELCKDMADLWTRWQEITRIYFQIFGAVNGTEDLSIKLAEFENMWKGFIKKYYEDGHPHTDKKTNKFTLEA